MPATLDMLSPKNVQASKISLALLPNSEPLLPYVPITVTVNYDDGDPEGVSLPLVFVVQPGGKGGVAGGYKRTVYSRIKPTALTFTVPGAGSYLVSLSELFHNRWQGRLVLDVQGDGYGETIVRSRS